MNKKNMLLIALIASAGLHLHSPLFALPGHAEGEGADPTSEASGSKDVSSKKPLTAGERNAQRQTNRKAGRSANDNGDGTYVTPPSTVLVKNSGGADFGANKGVKSSDPVEQKSMTSTVYDAVTSPFTALKSLFVSDGAEADVADDMTREVGVKGSVKTPTKTVQQKSWVTRISEFFTRMKDNFIDYIVYSGNDSPEFTQQVNNFSDRVTSLKNKADKTAFDAASDDNRQALEDFINSGKSLIDEGFQSMQKMNPAREKTTKENMLKAFRDMKKSTDDAVDDLDEAIDQVIDYALNAFTAPSPPKSSTKSSSSWFS